MKGGILISFVFAAVILSAAQTFTTLHSFVGTADTDGAAPGYGALVQGFDGNLYGTTTQGGMNCSFSGSVGCGEVFKVTTGGSITTLYSFCPGVMCSDGNEPEAGLTLNTNGNLYSMTDLGGSAGIGTVFKITPAGVLTTLDSLSSPVLTGAQPLTTLVRASNGDFYGITNSGGVSGEGAVIRVSAAGAFHLLQSFNSTTTGTAQGDLGTALVQGTDGNFYGVAAAGGLGANPRGTVFRMTPGGAIKVLHTFTDNPDGNDPSGGLVQGADGNFYGSTRSGGAHSQGSIFKITPNGVLTILHSFCATNGCPDGFDPVGGLIQATDGSFYGTTAGGGTGVNPHGTVFKITPGGALKTLHSFNGSDGIEPFAGLVQSTDGNFYGTTNAGGTNGLGTVFRVSVGLSRFVELVSTSGKEGGSVTILGTDLNGASKVAFGAGSVAPVVISSTEINATVPAGATTNFVTVTTPSGMLRSNKEFLVIPQITDFGPGSGPPETVVTIKGVSLKQTTSVKFGGKLAALVTIMSDTEIQATVPAGAATGKITVTTPGGNATSAGSFTVT